MIGQFLLQVNLSFGRKKGRRASANDFCPRGLPDTTDDEGPLPGADVDGLFGRPFPLLL